MISLKLKLTFGAMIIGTLLLLAQSVIQFYSLRSELVSRIENEQYNTLGMLAASLEDKINDRLLALEAASGAVPQRQLDEQRTLERFLISKTTLHTLFDDLYIFSPDGRLLVDWPAKAGRRGLDMSSRDYIREVRKTLKPVISEPILGRATQQPIIVLAAPILNANGELVAILGGVLNLYQPNLLGELGSRRVGENGYFYLLSADRRFIAHPDRSRILQTMPERGVNPALDKAVYEGFEGTIEGVNSRGLQGLFTFKRLHTTGWLLASVIPSDEAMRPIAVVQRTMAAITLLLIATITPLLWWSLGQLVRPLGELAEEMRARASNMVAGQPAEPVKEVGSGEIRTVAAAFNEFLGARNRAESALNASEQARQRIMENLEKAREVAESANQAKSRFLANMSHEIRTPMNGVIGMLDLALMNPIDAETRDYLQTARSSADSLLIILNDILDISKIEAGKLEIERTPFDLGELLRDSYALLRPAIEHKGIASRLAIPEKLPPILVGDATRIRQVIANLLGNALKFTQRGQIMLEATVVGTRKRGINLLISVSDTGIGIAPERLDSIFQPFTQADGSMTRRFGGTGLGLTISRQLVELMGGELQVTSTQGLGSTFRFTLPLDFPEEGELSFQLPGNPA